MPRPKGAPNKVTKDVREFIAAFVEDNLETMQRDFDQLEPVERLRFIEKLMQYVVPKKTEKSLPPEMAVPNLPPWFKSSLNE